MNIKCKVLKDLDSLGLKKGQTVLISEQFAKENPKHFKEVKPVAKAQSTEPGAKDKDNGSNS